MSGMRIAVWRQIPGSGQQISFSISGSVQATYVLGAQTNSQTTAIAVSALGGDAIVAVGDGASFAASVLNGQLVKQTDPPLIIGCVPGQRVAAIGLEVDSGLLYVTELSH